MSWDLNFVVIIGRLVRDPEIKYTTSGIPVTKFTIANNSGTVSQNQNEKKDNVNYFDITVWGNQAINCDKYLKKGNQVAIEGSLRQNRWNDQTTGKTISKIDINARAVYFLSQPQTQQSQQSNFNIKNNGVNYPPTEQTNNFQNKNINLNPWNDDPSQNISSIDYSQDPYNNEFGNDDDIPF